MIKEDPYKNFNEKSRCDLCNKPTDRHILKRYVQSSCYTMVRICPKCCKEMFELLGTQYGLQELQQDNVELQYVNLQNHALIKQYKKIQDQNKKRISENDKYINRLEDSLDSIRRR